MGFNCGIVGLPNVGKSTLFNALTQTAAAAAANYPFCTIEPNIGRLPVPDPRLDLLAKLGKSAKKLPTQLEIKDIAGLVRGASKGEGLGNQFLGAIREVDAILEVLRCFEDDDITHVEGGIDPLRDAELIETELLLADIDSLTRQKDSLIKRVRGQDKEAKRRLELVERLLPLMEDGQSVRRIDLSADEQMLLRDFTLMTAKPILFVLNVDESSAATGNEWSAKAAAMAEAQGAGHVVVTLPLKPSCQPARGGPQRLPREPRPRRARAQPRHPRRLCPSRPYHLLHRRPQGSPCLDHRKGLDRPPGGRRHPHDFERGFIAAEIIKFDDFAKLESEQAVKEAGKMKLEGRDYIVQDGDVCHFRFNV